MRVLRRLVIAAVLAVGVAVLHIRSMSTADQMTSVRILEDGRPARLCGYKVRSYRGHLFFSKIECDDDSGIYSREDLGWRFRSERDPLITLPGRRQNGIERLGFIFGSEGGPPVNPWRQTYAFVPHWAVTALLVLTATPLWFQASRALRARRRIAAGKCVSCGYDLRANTSVCPECGAALTGGAPIVRSAPHRKPHFHRKHAVSAQSRRWNDADAIHPLRRRPVECDKPPANRY